MFDQERDVQGRIAQLWVYPVKSCAGIALQSSGVGATGLAWDRSPDGLDEWDRGMTALAAMAHVHLKISELGLAGAPWDYQDNRALVRQAIEIFGFDRCMFASNFPVAGLRISYVDQVSAIAHMIQDCSAAERAALFHDTAKKFYRL